MRAYRKADPLRTSQADVTSAPRPQWQVERGAQSRGCVVDEGSSNPSPA